MSQVMGEQIMDKSMESNMQEFEQPLFEGKLVCLAPIDREKDAEIEAKWTHDAAYQRMLDTEPARPLSPAKVKKNYEAIEKEIEEKRNRYYFTIRTIDADRLVGFARFLWISWSHGHGAIRIGIGDPDDRRKGYGQEALHMLLKFAFQEVNLYKVDASVPEYNLPALRLFKKAGFLEEVRRREALNRGGKRWDMIHLGLLREEWDPNWM